MVDRNDYAGNFIRAYEAGEAGQVRDKERALDEKRRSTLSAYAPAAMRGDRQAIDAIAQDAPDIAMQYQQYASGLDESARKKSQEMWEWVGQALVRPDGSPIATPQELENVKALYLARGGKPEDVANVSVEQVPMLIQASQAARKYQLEAKGSRTFEQDMALRQAGATSVTVNNAAESAFQKGTGEFQAKMFGGLAQAGPRANAQLGTIGSLRKNLSQVPGGFLSGMQGLASKWGIKLGNNIGAVEAADAIISRLVPDQREPGSGPMSDRDIDLFKDSLPKLVNTPQGNALILDTMEAMARYQIDQAKIASAAMTGQIDRAEATQALMSLPDPMAKLKQSLSTGTQPATDGWSVKKVR